MKVKAKNDKSEYCLLEKGRVYDVEAIIYFITPFIYQPDGEYFPSNFVNPLYSGGFLPNEVVYSVKCRTAAGGLTMARFLACEDNLQDNLFKCILKFDLQKMATKKCIN